MNPDWLAAFLIGLLGSGHCMGMCGGIASLMNLGQANNKKAWFIPVFYNLGRLLTYMLAGAVIGGSVASVATYSGFNSSLSWLRLISAIFMLLLALYIGQWWQGLLAIEKAGQHIWRYVSPFGQKLLPLKHPLYAIPFGFIWGWLPCGLVYSMLTWSAAAGTSLDGAFVMLAFGFGTLPAMLLVGVGTSQFKSLVKRPIFKQIGAILLMIYALFQLYQGVVRLL